MYRFLRSNGDLLYVGKATSLKKRVTSHFVGRAGTPQAPEMLTQVSEIQVAVAASALEAALLENETIKALRPLYNVQLTGSDPRFGTARVISTPVLKPRTNDLRWAHCPREYSLRTLAALIALVGGASSSASLRSSAVGVSALWTPDPGRIRRWVGASLRRDTARS